MKLNHASTAWSFSRISMVFFRLTYLNADHTVTPGACSLMKFQKHVIAIMVVDVIIIRWLADLLGKGRSLLTITSYCIHNWCLQFINLILFGFSWVAVETNLDLLLSGWVPKTSQYASHLFRINIKLVLLGEMESLISKIKDLLSRYDLGPVP